MQDNVIVTLFNTIVVLLLFNDIFYRKAFSEMLVSIRWT